MKWTAWLSILLLFGIQADLMCNRVSPALAETSHGPSEALLRRAGSLPDLWLPSSTSEPELHVCNRAQELKPLRGRIDPKVIEAAGEQLNLPMGMGRVLSVRGRTYVFCLEPHYHATGSGAGPEGWHKGVTVYDGS